MSQVVVSRSNFTSPSLLAGLFACAALFIVSWLILGTGVGSGYLADDLSTVWPLRDLRESPELFWDLVLNDRSGPLGRPLSTLTFALEQSLFAAEPELSRHVSIFVHLVNGAVLFALAKCLLESNGSRYAFAIAFIITTVWLVTPQKISSVLYIVQRMALLSTFFVLLAVLLYVKARLSGRHGWRVLYSIGCLICVCMAPFAKENGALAAPLIAATEIFALPKLQRSQWDRSSKRFCSALLLLCVCAFVVYGVYEYQRSEVTYLTRNFDYLDRLMTAPAALVDYAQQFFLPAIDKMGLVYDDYPLGGPTHRPFHFWLGVCLLGLAAVMLASCLFWRSGGMLPYGLAVFIIGHSIESFYLPLELYYEHRNYLPSFGLALMIAPGVGYLLSARSRAKRWGLVLVAVYLTSLAASTLVLCTYWRSPEVLLQHHLTGHPRSARANADFALMAAILGEEKVARTYLDSAVLFSREEAAAMVIGDADLALLRVAVACHAGAALEDELPKAAVGGGVRSLHTYSIRLLRRTYEDTVCPKFDWAAVSGWIWGFVNSTYDRGEKISGHVLRDLVGLERTFDNPLRLFVYVQMALEQFPNDGMLHLVKLRVAARVGDDGALSEALEALEDLAKNGHLRPLEARLYRIVRGQAKAVDD